jgi:hypothetical protein
MLKRLINVHRAGGKCPFLRVYPHIWDDYFAGIRPRIEQKWLFLEKQATFFESIFLCGFERNTAKKEDFGDWSSAEPTSTPSSPYFMKAILFQGRGLTRVGNLL